MKWALRTLVLILLTILIAPLALAKKPPPPKPQNPTAEATATSAALAVAAASAETAVDLTVLQDIEVLPGQPVNIEGDTDNSVSVVEVVTRNPRQAPPAYAPSLNNTAPYLKCIGLSGSGAKGGAAGGGALGWCWLQRDVYAAAQYDRLAVMCMPDQAAKAYCRQKLHWQPHGSIEQCQADMSAAVEQSCQEPEPSPPPAPSQCDEKLARCESHAMK